MAIFQKRHYEAIAEVMKTCLEMSFNVEDRAMVGMVRSMLAFNFAKDNPDFKHDKFLKACGMEKESCK
ncbi:hypothetical protein IID24_05345 [Patescibacteria group bacterium]|nr:hypothetical protein [Patescibacteria group bacterium]